LHRERMFREAGWSEEVLTAMAEPFRRWLAPRVQDGRYIGWVAEEDVTAIAGLGMMIIEWSPHPSHPTLDRRGYILNLFVEPAHRRARLASRLMGMAIDTHSAGVLVSWCYTRPRLVDCSTRNLAGDRPTKWPSPSPEPWLTRDPFHAAGPLRCCRRDCCWRTLVR
jgi:GNAT superfamily N-acetyltransferase